MSHLPAKFAVITLLAAALGGCGDKDGGIIGKWKDRQGAVITFQDDHTFSQSDAAAYGKWSFANGKLHLAVQKIQGMAPEDFLAKTAAATHTAVTETESEKIKQQTADIVLTLSDDGKTLTPDDPTIGGFRTLAKQEER